MASSPVSVLALEYVQLTPFGYKSMFFLVVAADKGDVTNYCDKKCGLEIITIHRHAPATPLCCYAVGLSGI